MATIINHNENHEQLYNTCENHEANSINSCMQSPYYSLTATTTTEEPTSDPSEARILYARLRCFPLRNQCSQGSFPAHQASYSDPYHQRQQNNHPCYSCRSAPWSTMSPDRLSNLLVSALSPLSATIYTWRRTDPSSVSRYALAPSSQRTPGSSPVIS
jgi:hypothetical protein